MRLLTYIEALRPFYPGLGEGRTWNGTTKAADVQHCPRLEEWPGFWTEVHKVIRECSGKESPLTAFQFRTLKPPGAAKEPGRFGHGQQAQQYQPLLSAVDVSNLLDITIGRPVMDILRNAYGIDAGFEDPRSAVPIGDPNRVLLVGGPTGERPLDGFIRGVRCSRGDPHVRVRVWFVEFLSRNLASTFRGVLEVGQVPREVVFKVYDLSIPEVADVCAEELKAYAALTPIQGTIVPRIWVVGTLYGIYRVIAMDPCGEPVPEPPPPEFYEQAPVLFRAIHHHGVVHNDIDLRNFLVSHGQYRVIDLNSAKLGTPTQIEREERYLQGLLQRMKKGYIYRSQGASGHKTETQGAGEGGDMGVPKDEETWGLKDGGGGVPKCEELGHEENEKRNWEQEEQERQEPTYEGPTLDWECPSL
ncbi:hypothetical protein TWF679_000874 [Orbilia oligospora]|uniref:Protein kinase domain-containing protein n=1 Tax=Orbilia oligospora TaxID=2813651 RepID=A0A8H8VHG0_ORBOL|nr:hypothetical protein TWF679_000874 [Orbilia oligospora]